MKPEVRAGLTGKISRFYHSMRFRLSMWYLVVLAVALLFFGATIYSIEERSLSGAIDAELGLVADPISKIISTENGQFKLPPQMWAGLQQITSQNLSGIGLGDLQNFPGIKSLLSG